MWAVQWQSFRKTSLLTQHRLSSLYICYHLEQKSEKVHTDNAEGKQVAENHVESCLVTLLLKFSLCFQDCVFRCRSPVWGIGFFLIESWFITSGFSSSWQKGLCVSVGAPYCRVCPVLVWPERTRIVTNHQPVGCTHFLDLKITQHRQSLLSRLEGLWEWPSVRCAVNFPCMFAMQEAREM